MLLGVAFGRGPGLDGQIETADVLVPADQPLLHENAGEAVGQGQGGLAQNPGAYGSGVHGDGLRKGAAQRGRGSD